MRIYGQAFSTYKAQEKVWVLLLFFFFLERYFLPHLCAVRCGGTPTQPPLAPFEMVIRELLLLIKPLFHQEASGRERARRLKQFLSLALLPPSRRTALICGFTLSEASSTLGS